MTDLPLAEELIPCPTVPDALRALDGWRDVVLFDSALQSPLGRYSFLTADPFAWYEIDRPEFGADPFAAIRHEWRKYGVEHREDLPPFQGGAAGMLSYELGQCWERIPSAAADEFQFPALAVGLYDWTIAWDHGQNRAWVVSHGLPAADGPTRRQRASARLRAVTDALCGQANCVRNAEAAGNSQQSVSRSQDSQITLSGQFPANGLPGLTSDFSRDRYLDAVRRVIEYIEAGDIFQANLSQRLLYRLDESPLALYERLRQCNPAPFAGYFAHDDWAVLSASPERFVSVREDQVQTRPIKGTRARQQLPEADLFTRDELRESEKDQAENVMIVDLLRNDLSRVCRPGSVRVGSLCQVESYETVQHLVSEVHGRLNADRDVWDLLSAVFPGGSITGAPKVRAMQIIAELEPTARGPYCGSLFYAGFDGRMDSSILIRTFSCRHGWVQCPVGGGIVAQSEPQAEYEETLHKAEGMLRAFR